MPRNPQPERNYPYFIFDAQAWLTSRETACLTGSMADDSRDAFDGAKYTLETRQNSSLFKY